MSAVILVVGIIGHCKRAEVLGPEWRHERVTARALPVTGGILHQRLGDALDGLRLRTIRRAIQRASHCGAS